MNPSIQILLDEIKNGSQEEKINNLIAIGDYVEFGYTKEEDLFETVQQLINQMVNENEPQVTKLFFRNISVAFTQPANFSEITFDAVIDVLDKKDPFFIASILYLLSMTYSKKYIPVISKYLTHPDEKVREEATLALTYLP